MFKRKPLVFFALLFSCFAISSFQLSIIIVWQVKYNEKVVFDNHKNPDSLIIINKKAIQTTDTIRYFYFPDSGDLDSFNVKLFLTHENKRILVSNRNCFYDGYGQFGAVELLKASDSLHSKTLDLEEMFFDEERSHKITAFKLR
jgi:hypothetical protein